MAGRIPEQFIEELLARNDIVDLIDSYIPLRKSGKDYVACCPFHSEKTPSFTVSQDKQFYHCFGCHAHGTAIGFLMEHERLDFIEAIHELAARAGMQVPVNAAGQAQQPDNRELYELLQKAERFYRQQLKSHPQGQQAIDYLRQRGLTGQIAAEYGVGYAPPGWDSLISAMGDQPLVRQRLLQAGLLIEKSPGRSYDRFRERIMFPIRDGRGRVIGFGGRILGATENGPKYLNSPETAVFHKGRELYGLYEARQAIRQLERLLVVEGYMDVLMLARHDIRYAVATLGTATSHEHLERMFRLVPEVIFCFDGDQAGREAAWRALQQALAVMREGRQARFMFLPEGEDPDTLVQKELQAGFNTRIEQSVTLSQFFFDTLAQRVDNQGIEGHAKLIEMAKPLLMKIPPGVFQRMMAQRLAEMTAYPVPALLAELGIAVPERSPPPRAQSRSGQLPPNAARSQPSLVRTAISLLLHFPALAQQLTELEALKRLEKPGIGLLVELLELLAQRPHLNTAAILEHWRDHQHGVTLSRLARQEMLLQDESDARQEFDAAISRLLAEARSRRMEALFAKSKTSSGLTHDEKDELKQLYSVVN